MPRNYFQEVETAVDNAQRSLWSGRRVAVDAIAERLARLVLPSNNESAMQAALERVFADEIEATGGRFSREVPTSIDGQTGRLDFLLTFPPEAFGIECKVKGSFDELLRQIERYLHPEASTRINDLHVEERFRRQGIAAALLSHALELRPPTIQEGATLWGAGIMAQNKPSRALFERFGFTLNEEYIPNVLLYSRALAVD